MTESTSPIPLVSSSTEQMFPALTEAQMRRFISHGTPRSARAGEVLVELGDGEIPIFVVISGELEVMRPLICAGNLAPRDWARTLHRRNQFAFRASRLCANSRPPGFRARPNCARKPRDVSTNGCGAERDRDASVHSAPRSIAGAGPGRRHACRLQSFRRHPAHQGIPDAQWAPICLHRPGARSRR